MAQAAHGAGRRPTKVVTAVAAVSVLVLLAAIVVLVRGGTGSLLITVSGPGGAPLQGVEVFVDGVKKCDASPCEIGGLDPGPHLVRAAASGYPPTADQAVSIEAGKHSIHNVALTRPSAGSGLKVLADGKGLKLYLDGEEVGPLPQKLTDLEPGEHSIRIVGERYEPLEQRVTVREGEVQTVGPLKPKVIKGLATIKAGAGAEGARVLLDGRRIPKLPATVEIPNDKPRQLVATKEGYEKFQRTITFEDGNAEKTFEITMVEASSGKPAAPPAASKVASRRPSPGAAGAKKTASAGSATLNMNSIPVSTVVLNGRPLGLTPKVGVKVPAGAQTVVFVHPEHGRKVQSTTVAAGETKTVMARFP